MKILWGILLILIGCTNPKKSSDNELHIPLSSEIPTIDPAACYDTVCSSVVYNSYETLFEYEYLKRPYQLRPLLAQEMPAIEESGKKIVIKIKNNILYHPHSFLPLGRTVKADDFVTAFKRQAFIPTQGKGWWLFENRIVGLDQWRNKTGSNFKTFFNDPIAGLEVIDDQTFIIRLTKPFPQLLYSLAMSFTSPIPREAIIALNNDFTQTMVGTGPFVLQEYNPSQQAIFTKFNDYNSSHYPTQGDRFANEQGLLIDAGKKIPFIQKISMTVMKEQQTSWLNFLSNKIDILNLTKDYYQAALDDDGKLSKELRGQKVQLQVAPTLIYWWLAFNMNDPVLGKNLLLRQAIAHAVDTEKFIKLFTSNVGQKANSIYPPGVQGYNPSVELPYKYDLAKAKEFLVKAGYPEGKGMPEITFDVRGNSALHRQMAEFVVQELRNIGIIVKPSLNTFPVFLERSRRGELQFWNGGWVLDYPDAENVLPLLSSHSFPPGPNYSFYSNKKVDKWFDEIKLLENNDLKFKLMANIENEVNKELPWIMLYYSRNCVLVQGRVANFRYSDIINNGTKYLRISDKP